MCVCVLTPYPNPPTAQKHPPPLVKFSPKRPTVLQTAPLPSRPTPPRRRHSNLPTLHTHTSTAPPSVTSTPQSFFFSLRLCALINYSSIPSRLGSTSSTETSDGQLPATSLPPEQKKSLRNMAVITDLRCDSAELGCC